MTHFSRRQFTQQSLATLVTFSLLETLCQNDLFADKVKPITVKWLQSVNRLGTDVKEQRLGQIEWQQKIEELFAQVELPDLLRYIDFERMTSGLQLADKGAKSLSLQFQEIEGTPDKIVYGKQIFALKNGCSVVPHGHNNMTTAFLMLQGECQGRHYDRLEDEKEHYIIRPTIDRKFSAGECSSISDYKDNVHWFKATSDKAFIFNIHVMEVRAGGAASSGRVYLDPNGEKLKNGLIRARKLDYNKVHELYG